MHDHRTRRRHWHQEWSAKAIHTFTRVPCAADLEMRQPNPARAGASKGTGHGHRPPEPMRGNGPLESAANLRAPLWTTLASGLLGAAAAPGHVSITRRNLPITSHVTRDAPSCRSRDAKEPWSEWGQDRPEIRKCMVTPKPSHGRGPTGCHRCKGTPGRAMQHPHSKC